MDERQQVKVSSRHAECVLVGISRADVMSARDIVFDSHDKIGHSDIGTWAPTCKPLFEAHFLLSDSPDTPAAVSAILKRNDLSTSILLNACTRPLRLNATSLTEGVYLEDLNEQAQHL